MRPLPDIQGFAARPLVMGDSAAVYQLLARSEQHDIGEIFIEEADIIADWQRPDYDISAHAIGIEHLGQLIGYAEHTGNGRVDAAVDPRFRRRGIGTSLALWLQKTGAEQGFSAIGSPVLVGSDADLLLESLGYHIRWHSWVLELAAGSEIPHRELPHGYSVGQVEVADLAAMHEILEDAFLEWSDRPRESLGDFEAHSVNRPGFEPWLLRGVRDPAGNLVAVAQLIQAPPAEVFIDRLATRKDQRNRGLAQALMADSFRIGQTQGAAKFTLSTDSRTGALDLYLKVGMQVTSTWVNRAITLT
jgi:mycothiol synthase